MKAVFLALIASIFVSGAAAWALDHRGQQAVIEGIRKSELAQQQVIASDEVLLGRLKSESHSSENSQQENSKLLKQYSDQNLELKSELSASNQQNLALIDSMEKQKLTHEITVSALKKSFEAKIREDEVKIIGLQGIVDFDSQALKKEAKDFSAIQKEVAAVASLPSPPPPGRISDPVLDQELNSDSTHEQTIITPKGIYDQTVIEH